MINKVSLTGHLGKDPKMTLFESGALKATIILATHDTYVNSVGRNIGSTQWHRLIAWGRTAEQVERMLHKGSLISLEGRLRQHKIDLKDGSHRVYQEIVLDQFELLLDQSNIRNESIRA